ASASATAPGTLVTAGSTRSVRRIDAPRHEVYRALLDPSAVAAWRVPNGMSCHVHEFDARESGSFRVSLTYDAPTAVGKTSAHTDTYRGHFARLVRDELVIEIVEFETANPDLQGQMTITTTLRDYDGHTLVVVVHEGLPVGVSNEDNETGTMMALDNLAALIEER
ncbi:MAG: SRPBCC domain-containing protein, partial [Acidimicrobiales bacterium]